MAETVMFLPSGSQQQATNAVGAEPLPLSRRLRRSYEAGHPKLLVHVDDTEDCGKAVYYASRRAARIGAKLVLLRVIAPSSYGELEWLSVAEVIRFP